MSQSTRKNNAKSRQSTTYQKNYYMLPLILIAAFLPLIMRMHSYNPKLSQFVWFWELNDNSDFFLYYKQIFLILTASLMLLILIGFFYRKHIRFNMTPALVPILLYAALALLSTVLSKYSSYGFTGVYEQFESVFALLSYCIIVFYAFYFVKSEDDLHYFLKYFIIGVLCLGLLGLTQTLGHDFLATDFGKKFYISSKFWNSLGDFQFVFPKNTSYLTLYNPNYVGVYTAFLIPILIVLLITCKGIKKRLLYALGLIGMLVSLKGSGSAAGVVSVIFCLLVILVLFRKYILTYKKFALPLLGVALILIIGISVAKYDVLKSTYLNKFLLHPTQFTITDIKTEDNLTISYKGNDLVIGFHLNADEMAIILNDQNNAKVPYDLDSSTGKVTIQDERFKNITITPVSYQNILCLGVNVDGKDWYFTNQLGDNTFYYLNPMNRFDKIVKTNSALFTGYEKAISGRGYIWSRSIPLLKNSLILGTGADSFVFDFPHQDYLYAYYTGMGGYVLTKPHNLYLQIGIQTGVLSLIAFLSFYGIYFVNCLRLFWRGRYESYFEKVGVAIFVGTISYMITGLTNDSSIAVAPVFWVLIGIGTAINYKLLTEKKQSR